MDKVCPVQTPGGSERCHGGMWCSIGNGEVIRMELKGCKEWVMGAKGAKYSRRGGKKHEEVMEPWRR